MPKPITKEIYHEKVGRVVDYIHGNLDADLSFETLADIACLSPYHYHRIYRAILGETVTQSIRRLRLQRAAGDLIKSSHSITKIARQATYQNTDSFTRKFSEAYGLPPQAYRDQGQELHQKLTKTQSGDKNMYTVEIITLKDFTLGTLSHIGDYMDMGPTFEKLLTSGAQQGLMNENTQVWGMYYDDPQTVPKEELRGKAGITIAADTALKEGIEVTPIDGGKFAKIFYKGPYNELEIPYRWIYQTWLLESGHEPKNAPVIEEYLNSPHDVAPKDLLTAIHIPLKD